jgi:hypothetical protein
MERHNSVSLLESGGGVGSTPDIIIIPLLFSFLQLSSVILLHQENFDSQSVVIKVGMDDIDVGLALPQNQL